MRLLYASLLVSSLAAAAEPLPLVATSADGKVRIQIVPDDVVHERLQGCGCSFSVPRLKASTPQPMVIGWVYADTSALMKINDRLEEFKLFDIPSGRREPDAGEPNVGDEVDWLLRGDLGQVVLHTRVSQTCAKHSACEVTGFSGTAKAEISGVNLTFGVVGSCGC